MRASGPQTVGTRAFIAVLLVAFYYVGYRYPFKINSALTSPTYSDTPTALQIGKYVLMLGVCCWFLAVTAAMPRGRRGVVGRDLRATGAAMLLVGVFAVGKGTFLASVDVISFGFDLLVGVALWICVVAYGLDSRRISRVWSVFVVLSIATIVVQWTLFLTVGRLPALAYADSVSVRFGAIWDDPNGYALIVAALVPAVLFGWRKHRILGLVTAFLLLASTALTLSFTGVSSALVALLVGLVVLHWKSSSGRVLLAPGFAALAMYGAWPYLSSLPYIADVLHTKSASFADHAQSLTDLQNLGLAAIAGFDASPGPLSESGYVWLFQSVGVPFTAAYVLVGIGAMVRLARRIIAAPQSATAAHYAFFFYLPAYLIGLLNLQLSAAFPTDLLYVLGVVFACSSGGLDGVPASPSGEAPAPRRRPARLEKRGVAEVRAVLTVLRSSAWLLLATMVVGGGVGLALTRVQTPLYTSTTQFFLSMADTASPSDLYDGSAFLQDRVNAYAALADGQDLTTHVVERLGLPMSPEQLSDAISAAPVPQTALVNVSVTDPSPEQSARIAEAVTVEFPKLVAHVSEAPVGGGPRITVAVTQTPSVPGSPSSPLVLRHTALGLLTGLLVGAALAFARVAVDRSVRSVAEAVEISGAPVVGTIVQDRALLHRGEGKGLESPRTAEAYRQVRNNLRLLDPDNPWRTLLVSSALPGEGRTATVTHLARALSQAGRSVVVVDADLRHPMLTRSFELDGAVGLVDVLADAVALDDAVHPSLDVAFSVVPAGRQPVGREETLVPGRFTALLGRLQEEHDFVLVDGPPLLQSADASALADSVDGVLLVVRHGRTRTDQLQQASASLSRAGATVVGTILSLVPPNSAAARASGQDRAHWPPAHARA